MAGNVASSRQAGGYSLETFDGASPAEVAPGVSQVGAPAVQQVAGKVAAQFVQELILQELRTMNALLTAAIRGGPMQDVDLLKQTTP